jgi:hypothetical protein
VSAPTDNAAQYTLPTGTVLAYNTDGSTWVTIGNLIEIQSPGIERTWSPATNLSSAAETSNPNWRKQADFSFKVYFVASVATALTGFITSSPPTILNFRVQYPLILSQSNNSTWTWTGYINKFSANKQTQMSDEKVMYEFTGKEINSGVATFTAGS